MASNDEESNNEGTPIRSYAAVGLMTFCIGALLGNDFGHLRAEKAYHPVRAFCSDITSDEIKDIVIDSDLRRRIFVGEADGGFVPLESYLMRYRERSNIFRNSAYNNARDLFGEIEH